MRRENSSRRRSPYRQPRATILIVCGGCRTEPKYFEGLRRSFRNPAVVVKVVAKALAPAQLVERAKRLSANAADVFDEVWCVVDVDDFDIKAAAEAAARCGVKLAVSNPCFEFWLLLHFADCRSPLTGYEEAVRRLRKYVSDYDKAALTFSRFEGGIMDALQRAEAIDPTAAGHDCNPSSGVWKLVRGVLPSP